MNWTLGTTLRADNQPAPAPVIYITGETLQNGEDVTHLGQLIAESVFSGKHVGLRTVLKDVNPDFEPLKDGPEGSATALRTMLVNLVELDIGGFLTKGNTFIFTVPDMAAEEWYHLKGMCKMLAGKRESALLHLHLETTMVGGTESLTIKFEKTKTFSRKLKVDLLLRPQDTWETTMKRIHDTLCALVAVNERTHLIKGDFLEFNDDFHPDSTRRMTIAEVCSTESAGSVQFACLVENWPVWDPEAKLLSMRICDRTASVNITFKGVDEDAFEDDFMFTLEPGTAKQLACDVVRKPRPSRNSNWNMFSSIAKASHGAVPATKGFLKSARASFAQKFYSRRK